MIFNPEEFRERIILYLNGRLPEKEREIFEETLKKDPERARELKEFSEIKEGYEELEEGIPIPSEALYER
ncbi:MAG: anti-sigma factor family protein, partial [Thermodesulfobacteriota bacterium]